VDGDGGGDGQPEPSAFGHQGDGPDLVRGIRDGAAQPHPQRRVTFGDRQPHPPALELEGLMVEAHWDQPAFAAWKSGRLTVTAALGGLKPGVRIATKHRPGPVRRQLPCGSSCGELAAQRLIADDRWHPFLEPLPVGVQQPRPDVTGGTQQPIAAVGLAASDAQADAGGAVDYPDVDNAGARSELMFGS
jgi:hypothetical protein